MQSIYNIITTSQGKLTAIYPALLAVINNIAAYLENLSASASSKLLQLFASMSSPGFLLANDSNHNLLQSLLESINAIIEHQYISQYPPFYIYILSLKISHHLESILNEYLGLSYLLVRHQYDVSRFPFPT